jgi:MtaA/CmuA family methyltransferase
MPSSMSTMTGRERIFAAVTMSALPDQIPCIPLLLTRAIREGGTTCDVAQVNPEIMAAAKMKAVRKFGGDAILAGTDLFTPAENLGAELDYLPYAQPSLVKHPAPTREAFHQLRDVYAAKGFNPDAGRLRHVAREIQIYVENGWRETHVIAVPVGGPLTTAQLLTGSSEFLGYMAEDPVYAKDVIALALDCIKHVCKMMFEAGADVCNILEPFCSSDILPPEIYREFGLPAQQELFAYIGSLGGAGISHICTYTQPIWRDIAKSGCLNFNGDMYPGMDHAKRAIGGEISLMGAVSPFSTLLHGSPVDVANEVRKLAAEVGYNGGFVCMPGCDIDWTIPDENLHALVDACASIKYPMDIQALGDLSKVYLAGHPRHLGTRIAAQSVARIEAEQDAPQTPEEEVYARLIEAIMDYDGEKAVEWTKKGLEHGLTAQQIVFQGLSLGMKVVGDMYERNERFVTDMLKAARTMDKAMPILAPLLEASGSADGPSGTVVMGLVRGNTQDIGKNLVCLMLKANGFKVIDLGKNVRPEQFVQAAEESNAIAIGMSVMTNSSTTYVEKVVEMLQQQGAAEKYLLMCGGAAANRGLADRLGVRYGSDANAAVALVKERLATAA